VVGYRPSRASGPRIERGPDLEDTGIKVVYNYGHGGAGWQACWGAAEETRDIVLGAESDQEDGQRVKAKL
jgi:D-amino-acid oxidase